jgi:hypothetical protein
MQFSFFQFIHDPQQYRTLDNTGGWKNSIRIDSDNASRAKILHHDARGSMKTFDGRQKFLFQCAIALLPNAGNACQAKKYGRKKMFHAEIYFIPK